MTGARMAGTAPASSRPAALNHEEVLDQIDQGVVTTDAAGVVTALTRRAEELLGMDEPAAVGRPCAEVIAIRDEEVGAAILGPADSALSRCLLTGESWQGALSGVDVDGAAGPAVLRLDIKPLGGGALILIGDATPLREVLEAHDALISITSHELKTPLTAIKAMSELLLAYDLDEEQRKEMVGDIFHQAERLEQLIREILDASQIDSGRMALDLMDVNLRDALGDVLDELQTQIGTRPLKVTFPKTLPHVRADPAKLRQVLVNLITNAIKYSPEPAPVTVKASAGTDAVQVEVRDQGIGIRPEDLSRLFRKFQRIPDPASRRTAGTGLGLYIVKGLVELQGGEVSVTSDYGKGSTFGFTLPVARG